MRTDRAAATFDAVDRSRNRVQALFWTRPWNDRGWLSRSIFSAITALSLTSSLPSAAQEKPLQIGVLALGPRYVPVWRCGEADYRPGASEPRHDTKPHYVLGLLDELEKLKYVEARPENAGKPGRRFVLDFRTGTLPELRAFAREFAKKPVDMIVAIATLAVRVAQEETRGSSIPILMTAASEPVAEGFVDSLAKPGGYITGVSHQLVQGSGKRVELFKEMVPGLRRLTTMRMPGYTPSENSMLEIRAAADRLKIEVLDLTFKSRPELATLLANVRKDNTDGLMVSPDSLVISNLDLVLETSLARRIPTFALQDYMSYWGALAAYGPSAYQAGVRVAHYVDKISKGAKPGDIAVEPLDPVFMINLKAAECLGVTLPLEVLREADRIIR